MKFSFKNVRPIESGCIDINKLTILCGKNNTGKTYITNIIYSFLDTWVDNIDWELPEDITRKLYKDGAIKVDLDELISSNITDIRTSIMRGFTSKLPEYLACSKEIINKAEIDFFFNMDSEWEKHKVASGVKNFEDEEFLSVRKAENSKYAEILLKKTSSDFPQFIISDLLAKILVKSVFCIVSLAAT